MRPVARRRRKPPLGQHFLTDRRAVNGILQALGPCEERAVLEIGPGRGVLTQPLLRVAGSLTCVELDPTLAAGLRERFSETGLNVIEDDILRVSFESVRRSAGSAGDRRLLLVGNLPYAISKPIAQKLVRERQHVEHAVLMFQSEVAQRLLAEPGQRSYGPLGIVARQFFAIRPVLRLGPGSFRPPPRVRSTVTHWTRLEDSLEPMAEARLRACLGACFARRRQTLRNNLRRVLPPAVVERRLELAGLEGQARSEQVDPAGFLRLAADWPLPSVEGDGDRGDEGGNPPAL